MGLPGKLSSSQALDLVEQKVGELPAGLGSAWTGISRQEREASGQAALLYGLSLLALARPLGLHGGSSIALATGGYALAWSAGVMVPSPYKSAAPATTSSATPET